jgi:hypothetical protein
VIVSDPYHQTKVIARGCKVQETLLRTTLNAFRGSESPETESFAGYAQDKTADTVASPLPF